MYRKFLILSISAVLTAGSFTGCGLYSTELGHIVEETEAPAEEEIAEETEPSLEDEEIEDKAIEIEEDEESPEESAEEETEKPKKKDKVSKNSVSKNKTKKTVSKNKVKRNKVSENEADSDDEKETTVADPFHTTETKFYTRDNIDTCLAMVNSYTYGDEKTASNLSSAGTPVTYEFYNKNETLLFSILDFQSSNHVQIVTADGETHNYIYTAGENTGKYTVSRLTISQDNKAEKLAHLMLKGNDSYTYTIAKKYDINKDLDTDIDALERITVDAPDPYGYAQIYYLEDEDDASSLVKDAISEYKKDEDDIRLYKKGRVVVVLFHPTGAMIDALDDYDYDKQSMSGGSSETTPDDNTNPESN
ncbi:hypothetical protein SAMN06296386_10431 [Lachnospiraceae bacterium]|nr:hypothetical protein SAMN06296386_10431 [Lachnospiraceae bacterium]